MMERIPFTKEGFDALKDELRRLQNIERPKVIKAIEEARAHGDLSENAEYHAAKERQAHLEGRIQELQDRLARAEVIEPQNDPPDRVIFGVTVRLFNLDTEEEVEYKLVGPYESDVSESKISVTSPLGRALIGRSVGDEVEVKTPSGIKTYEILDITY
ncbi:transcription elongation factor GreA [Thermosulfuriphilus ammonigenes]|uniref:Transcription elongation factor GreA n=1 Tax=Thermosulfuriphilus ammonigenes TaxID=1936021 RepID=A0A6G7PYE5_9BACT|nr:transcription elongation factor GreA [Thermosulfuriphilus ammonigenes]MBA2848992.1 transcription elongation factor GreA [Thermosulfuriphilus ammonigenes]QIJ72682.1 transcription elongation factor GreA [Thermosulfuriphilus ammonigenes]